MSNIRRCMCLPLGVTNECCRGKGSWSSWREIKQQKFRVRNDDDSGSWKERCCIYLDESIHAIPSSPVGRR